jgi:hypothetical protein
MAIVQQVLNWFGIALLVLAAAVLARAEAAAASPAFMLLWTAPLLAHLCATRAGAPSAVRVLAMGANWVAGVLAGSLAAAAFIGMRGTHPLFPLLGCAALLFVWNAIRLAATSLR